MPGCGAVPGLAGAGLGAGVGLGAVAGLVGGVVPGLAGAAVKLGAGLMAVVVDAGADVVVTGSVIHFLHLSSQTTSRLVGDVKSTGGASPKSIISLAKSIRVQDWSELAD